MLAPAITSDYVRADGVSRSFADRRVLTDVSLTAPPGERLGLIGENGAGKSTLLRILAGVDAPDTGVLYRPRRTGFLWQELRFDPSATLGQVVEAALAEVRAIEAELDAAASALAGDPAALPHAAGRTTRSADPAERYAQALAEAERAEVWSVDARRDEVLDGLGVGGIPLDRRLDEVSGGQRSRVALAALLLQRPDALLLDEPTNHLDDAAAAYLERQLLGWSGPVLFASHDRAFLDSVATRLLDLDPSRGRFDRIASGPDAGWATTSFGAGSGPGSGGRSGSPSGAAPAAASGSPAASGAFTAYLAHKAAERERWERQFAEEQDELKQLKLAVDVTSRRVAPGRAMTDNNKMMYDASGARVESQVSRRVRNARQRLDTLSENQLRKPPALLSFGGIPHGSHALTEEAGILIQATDATVHGRLAPTSLRVEPQSRILLTGANGAGKSTLLTALAGGLSIDGGSVVRRKGVRIALLEQDVRFDDPSSSPRAIYEKALGPTRAEKTPLAGLGLLSPRDLDRPLGALSVGQQRRLALALIIARPPHVFLLDEPTNHLSLGLAGELEEALSGYPGAVVVASHDRWLRSRWQGEVHALGAR
ncbi:ABC-F family ATP-binding cassette domain-containing protein [Compostimonas suwonensis]|uniref:ABC-F family ATP-binding cassette domain-containing protein n=1 Tax=Compostimonas suwonensis TaxID=1048394 RepID=UPI001FE9611F|nr:ABC-F family ATP-binding cassette domain-containing protein [Compostimonas suwonensis]